MKPSTALDLLCTELGFDDVDAMLEQATFDSVCPGICMHCTAVHDTVEPDADANYCDSCHKPRVKSCLSLAGLV